MENKMKIALCSDVHLEFGQLILANTEGAEVLILSGDICVATDLNARAIPEILGVTDKSNRYHEFFQMCSKEFKQVIYIAGNHEHYHGDFAKSIPRIRENLAYLKNVHFLDKEFVTFGDVTFIGGTLWTDMNKEDPHTLYSIKSYMNDYRIIENSSDVVNYKTPIYGTKEDGSTDYTTVASHTFRTRSAKFSPENSVADHKAMLWYIDSVIKEMPNEKFVVVGHHSPSKLSTKPQYENDVMVNGAYSSDLSEFILDRPQIKAWTHGHTHHKFDYMIGSTRIICNPRGYIGYEPEASDFELQYFEV
jgi:Icc-related predicted phosphoesterase